MTERLSVLAAMVEGKLVGDDASIHGAAVLNEAAQGDITFIDQPEKIAKLAQTRASAVVVPAGIQVIGVPRIEVADVHEAFATLVRHFHPPRARVRGGINPAARISPTARIGRDVEIGPGAFVGDDVEVADGCVIGGGVQILAGSRIGECTTIYNNAVIYENTQIGARCTIHAGAVIGSFGFGYRQVAGRHQLTAQLGHVRLESDVEIGANSTIDRGSYGATVIGEGTKIDNQVQIGHNCRIGRHNLICAQVGIAGSTTTGDYVVMAGQVGVRDHVHIGTGAVLGAMAGISNDVPEGCRVVGIPATPEREQKVKLAALAKLPEMRKELKALAARVARLETTAGQQGCAPQPGSQDQAA
jgi:UDP-3-O-[3-hydroxymyristoyl] glucosamine N-acyltransferase